MSFGQVNASVHCARYLRNEYRGLNRSFEERVMAKSAIVRWSDPELILVATNLLEGHNLLLHAMYQARLSRSPVLLVHVIRPSRLKSDYPEGAPSFLPSSAVQFVRATLDESVKDFRREGILCEPIVLAGSPAEQVRLLVKWRAVDRVIIATRYASGIERLVEPSVAEELITTLEVPVCVIGRRARPGPACGTRLGRVLMAASLRPSSAMLAQFASTLAELNHAQLTLLHVIDRDGMSDEQRETARMEAQRKLAKLVPIEARYTHDPVLLIREGDPATIIRDEAGSLPQDVVILGSPRFSMVSQILTNSVAHRVVIESQCPVITIKPSSASSSQEIHELTGTEQVFTHS
jgi:nucleotide-binding universal stress UspA family protein